MNSPAPELRRQPPAWSFGDRLRLVRRDLSLTQAEMAIRIGVGLKSYSSWESGQARPADLAERAVLLEEVTGVDRAWWLGWADGPQTPSSPPPGTRATGGGTYFVAPAEGLEPSTCRLTGDDRECYPQAA